MRIRRNLATLLTTAAVLAASALTTGAAPAQAPASVPAATAAAAAAPGSAATALDACSAAFFDGDSRLGPQQLPVFGPVGAELFGYHRSGDLTDAQLLAQYYSPTANGGAPGWIYPPDNGYVIAGDGKPIETTQTLRPGQDIDRYGSEYGSFLAPAGLSYGARSIPPSSLDGTPAAGCNYHDYRVVKAFTVDAGPIAPWFGQPGHGWQYQLDGSLVPGAPAQLNVMWLVGNGYLDRV
ncbi:TNT domain-containing protein [Streptacidiphilus sp. PB12-B1b]|uniref:TNT domain-containing protein n=1 Tax=Streptacidiphilus sp. PB12-B1b TaxID=2705012 RepID=UPI0015F9FCA3|nr:TNT domain-containing protein [Streptacidiphilus sp. PB12-B1b]QMU76410.1 TNT domain-containing protein [Streptacidiphilus sp. PB12-B1b]